MKKVGLIAAIVAALGLGASPAGAKPGDVIVGDSGTGEVLRVKPATGATSVISDDPRLVNPNDSVFGANGALFVADYGAFANTGAVFKIDPRTGQTRVLAKEDPFVQPDGLALAPNGNLFVSDLDATMDDGALFRVRVPGGNVRLTSSGGGLVDAVGVVVPPGGKPVVSGLGSPTLVRVNPRTGDQRTIADAGDGLAGEGGLTRAPRGTLYVVDNSALEAVNPRTGDVDIVATGFATNGYGLAIDFRGRVLGADNNGHEILRANPGNGDVETIADGLDFAEGLEVEPPRCGGKLATIVGTTRPDVLRGSRFDDVIHGLGKGDVIKGLKGNDRACGDKRNDKIKDTKGKNRIDCGPGKRDVAITNQKSRVRNCEKVVRR